MIYLKKFGIQFLTHMVLAIGLLEGDTDGNEVTGDNVGELADGPIDGFIEGRELSGGSEGPMLGDVCDGFNDGAFVEGF